LTTYPAGKASKPLELFTFDPQLKAGLAPIREVSIDSRGECA
jgi:hypothetical protein